MDLALAVHLGLSAERLLRSRMTLKHALCLHRFEHELRQLRLAQKTSVASDFGLWW